MFQIDDSFHLIAKLCLVLGFHGCHVPLHQASGTSMDNCVQKSFVDQGWKWLVSFLLTFHCLELRDMATFNYERN